MTKSISQLCKEALELREKALFKGRVRFDKEGDLVCDALSGVLDSVKVIASSSEKSVLMDEDALFFAHAANHIKQIAKKYLELESENKKLREALKRWILWEQEQIRKEGPYAGKEITALIEAGEKVLKELGELTGEGV